MKWNGVDGIGHPCMGWDRWDSRHFRTRCDGMKWDRWDGTLVGWDRMGHSTLSYKT